MPKVPYPYKVNGKLVTGNGSLIPICSLLNSSLMPSLTVLLLKCVESATNWLYPKNVSDSTQALKQWIKVDKLDFFKNAS